MGSCELLTKSYHIQPAIADAVLDCRCELLTKSYHIQQVIVKFLFINSKRNNLQKKSCIMIDEIPPFERDFLFLYICDDIT